MENQPEKPSVIDYEGSDYQTSFWDEGNREYEDRTEKIALKRLLPDQGKLLLEIGAGAGRNTLRYQGFERIVLLDYSLSQLQQAQGFLGRDKKFIYVQKIQNIYIALIVSTLDRSNISEEMNFDQIIYFNKMLENVSKNLLINIKRIILGHLKKKNINNGLEWPDNLFFKEIIVSSG